jgi:hypothetical protein
MINIGRFGRIADQRERKFPGTPTTCSRCATVSLGGPGRPRGGRPDLRGHRRGRRIRHGLAAEEILLLHDFRHPGVDVLAFGIPGNARACSVSPAWSEGGLADLVDYPEDPRANLAVVRQSGP